MPIQSEKNQSFEIKAPTDGFVVTIDHVPDPVFAEETLGPGIAIEPLGDTLCAPLDGKIIQCAPTKHAVTIEAAPGVEILVHMGIDTVAMKGEGLSLLVKEGDKVKAGTPLIRFDVDLLAQHVTSLISPLVSIGKQKFSIEVLKTGKITQGAPMARLMPVEAIKNTSNANEHNKTVKGQATLALENGMHARPASKLKAIAENKQVKITLGHKNRTADAGSITELLNLGLMEGDKVTITIAGANAADALEDVRLLLQTPEGVEKINVAEKAAGKKSDTSKGLYYGVVASNGYAVAPLFPFTVALPSFPENSKDKQKEKEKFLSSLNVLQKTLDKSIQAVAGTPQADILFAHRALLDDDDLTVRTLALIEEGKSAAFSWKRALDEHITNLEKSPNPLIRERTGDMRDLQIQLVNLLVGRASKTHDVDPQSANKIIVAHDLTPSQMIALAALKPAGICLEAGGITSHVAILCRGSGIPCIMGVGEALLKAAANEKGEAILDAENGVLELSPSKARIADVQKMIKERHKNEEKERTDAHKPAVSKDKHTIEVGGNIANALEAERAYQSGGDGIGLFRSEFLFLDRDQAPTIKEQYSEYQRAVDAMQGKPVVIRTLDIGADKQLSWLRISDSPNPALGVRGIRLLESNPTLIEDQLKALLEVNAKPLANGKSSLQIMLPMVSDVTDIIATRKVIERFVKEMGLKKKKGFIMPQIGAMIEVPSAALTVETIAKEADFLSIGTNDLTQYTLAMDREETHLAHRLDVLHPAMLRLIGICVADAKKHDCPVAVCGAAAGDPVAGIVLAALGVDELSVEPSNIAATKARLRKANLKEIKTKVSQLMAVADGAELRQALTSYLKEKAVLS